MGIRQHRCPFYLLKITPKDLEFIKTKKLKDDNLNKLYEKQLNNLTIQYQSLKGCFDKIVEIISPFLNNKTYYSLEDVVDNSLLNPSTKKATLSLIKKYTNYCREKMLNSISKENGNIAPNELPNLFNPENAFNFISNKENKYKRSSIKKNLNISN